MNNETFGTTLKGMRKSYNLSVKELSELSGVSTAYISKLENQKRSYPTKEVIMSLASGFRKKMSEDEDISDVVESMSVDLYIQLLETQDSPFKNDVDFIDSLNEFNNFYMNNLETSLKNLSSMKQDIFLNNIQLSSKSFDLKKLEKPYFDLEWMLSQKDFEVFFGRSILLNDIREKQMLNEKEMYFYNTFSSEDKKLILEIIKLVMKNKYENINDELEFFKTATQKENAIFNELYKYNDESENNKYNT